MQFGAEPLFENISAKFGNGTRYGLIGANGCGKSTFMKILSGALVPTAGNVSIASAWFDFSSLPRPWPVGRIDNKSFCLHIFPLVCEPETNS